MGGFRAGFAFSVTRKKTMRHLLSITDLSAAEIKTLITRTQVLKKLHYRNQNPRSMAGKVLAMLFRKPSTRTRVSFEAGMAQLGGSAFFMSPEHIQLGRGETIADSARVISSMVDMVMFRTYAQAELQEFADNSSVPLINGLSDDEHPCQVLSDLFTYHELRGEIRGRKVAWIGDFNNVSKTYIKAAEMLKFELTIACPANFVGEENRKLLNSYTTLVDDPAEAARNAHLIMTDTWSSMGKESEKFLRRTAFEAYQVNEDLLSIGDNKVLFMHCLPAYRGEEISNDLLDDPRSCVWQQAENRLHMQKAIMEYFLPGASY